MKWIIKKTTYFLSILLLNIIKFINKIYLIRISTINIARIGGIYHLDWELSKKKINNIKSLDIYFYSDPRSIVNVFWRDLWQSKVTLIKVPNFFITTIDNIKSSYFDEIFIKENRVNITGKDLAFFKKTKSLQLISKYNLLLDCILKNNIPNIQITKKDLEKGTQFLSSLGIDNRNFICIHNRDNSYLNYIDSRKNWTYHDYRDFEIEDCREAIIEMINRGYYVLRMGSVTKNKLNLDSKYYFDYSNSQFRSDFLDVFLLSQCKFFISSDSGISAIAEIFKKPIVYINKTLHRENHKWSSEALVIYKKFFSTKLNKYLSFEETYELPIGDFDTAKILKEQSLNIINNTSDEILEAAKEMDDYIKKKIKYTDKDERLQKKYWDIFAPNNKRSINFRLGKHFLQKNSFLL